jgi:hypothetical protein
MTTISRAQGAEQRSPAPLVVGAGLTLLAECAALVRQSAASDGVYAAASRVLPGGTIGKHVRHSLDHFRAVLEGSEGGGMIDYDHRERDVPMESVPEAALEAIAELCLRLGKVGELHLQQPVRVRVMLSGSGEEAELASTLGRELAFATHHAVHHHAMIGAIAAEMGVAAGADFGKAPSTINHEKCRPPR